MKDLIGRTPIHPLYFYSGKMAGYICWLILFLLLFGVDVIDSHSSGELRFASYLFLGIGLILTFISLFDLGSSVRLGLPTDSTSLKSNGIYRFSRNPMYLGFHLMTIASIFYTLHILIIMLGILSIVCYHSIIKAEERFLKERFGEEYINYQNRVRRYI